MWCIAILMWHVVHSVLLMWYVVHNYAVSIIDQAVFIGVGNFDVRTSIIVQHGSVRAYILAS